MGAKPNVLIFMTDQQRGDTLAAGSGCIHPNIDKFRRNALHFTRASCPAPHCCPSRAAFLTGLYPSRHGVWNNVNVDSALSRGLYDGVRTFGEDLRDAGYRLFLAGKWHISAVEPPERRGFEQLWPPRAEGDYRPYPHRPQDAEWALYDRQATDDPGDPRGDGEIIRPGYPHYTQYGLAEGPGADERLVESAADRLRTLEGDDPFLMFVAVSGPHDPYFVPRRFLELYEKGSVALPESFDDAMADKPALYRRARARFGQLTREEQEESLRHYYAYCSYEDHLFGRLMDALEETGRAEDTIVLYCSDHGDYAGAHGLWTKGLPCFREAYDICFMLGGPGVVNPGRVCDAPVNLADWTPTLLELAGIPAERDFTGRSLAGFLRGQPPLNWGEDSFSQTNGNEIYGIQRAVWNRKWKYVFNSFDFDELYDLENDPQELHNLIYGPTPERGPYAGVVREMCEKLWRFARRERDGITNPYIMTAMAPFGPGILKDGPEQWRR